MLVNGAFQAHERRAQRRVWWVAEDHREARAQDTGIAARVEQRDAQAVAGDRIAVGAGEAVDEAAAAQPAQNVGDTSGGELAGLTTQEGSKPLLEITVGEAGDLQAEGDQDLEQRVRAAVPVAQPGNALAVGVLRLLEPLERVVADRN